MKLKILISCYQKFSLYSEDYFSLDISVGGVKNCKCK